MSDLTRWSIRVQEGVFTKDLHAHLALEKPASTKKVVDERDGLPRFFTPPSLVIPGSRYYGTLNTEINS